MTVTDYFFCFNNHIFCPLSSVIPHTAIFLSTSIFDTIFFFTLVVICSDLLFLTWSFSCFLSSTNFHESLLSHGFWSFSSTQVWYMPFPCSHFLYFPRCLLHFFSFYQTLNLFFSSIVNALFLRLLEFCKIKLLPSCICTIFLSLL